MNILITGSNGFVGRNLVAALKRREGLNLVEYDLGSDAAVLEEGLRWPMISIISRRPSKGR